MGPPHHARRGCPELAPNPAKGFGVPEDLPLGPHPATHRPRKSPAAGSDSRSLAPRTQSAATQIPLPRFSAPTLQSWRWQDARRGPAEGRGGAAGSLTHLRRRRLPAPPAPAPRPTAAALASRPPAPALPLGRARPLHSRQLRPRPLFPQREGRGRRGWDATGRATVLRFLPLGPFSGPCPGEGAVGNRGSSLSVTTSERGEARTRARPWAHLLQTSRF